jgi:hypothetical protein
MSPSGPETWKGSHGEGSAYVVVEHRCVEKRRVHCIITDDVMNYRAAYGAQPEDVADVATYSVEHHVVAVTMCMT